MKTAIIYLRVSTGKQAEKETPIESQREQCERKAKELGADVIKVFTDEGISGRSDRRPAFQDAIAWCETFPTDYFVTWSTSRFARNRLDAQINKKRLQRAGTLIEYVTVSLDQSDEKNSVLQEGILELFDEYFSLQVSQDTKRSMLKNAADGYWNGGRPSYGFQVVPDPSNPKKKKLSVEPNEAQVVKKIFKLRLDGMGAKAIADHLTDNGFFNRDRRWNKEMVLRALRNRSTIGVKVYGQKRADGTKAPKESWIEVRNHEPILDDETFYTVQNLMDAEGRPRSNGSPRSNWLFTGLLKCGKCGASMQIESAKSGSGHRIYYYNCRKARLGVCVNRRMNAQAVDDFLVSNISTKVFNKKNLGSIIDELNQVHSSWAKKKREQITKIITELDNLRARNNQLYTYLEDPAGELNLADLGPRLKENNSKIKALEAELIKIEAEPAPELALTNSDVAELSGFLISIIQNSANKKKVRNFFASFIDEILVAEDSLEVRYEASALVTGNDISAVPSKSNWLPLPDLNGGPAD